MSDDRASTGLDVLDEVLEGLFWGDNVVWQLDGVDVDPFYAAAAELSDVYGVRTAVLFSDDLRGLDGDGLNVVRAGPGTGTAHPAALLQELARLGRSSDRQLLLFDSLERMADAWGTSAAQGFFARCCPLLLELGAVAYWSVGGGERMAGVRDTITATTQCLLRVDERSVRIVKAEARHDGVRGAVLHWHEEDGRAVLAPVTINARMAASLRALRRARRLSQQDVAVLAGVTASAISQAERAERGLSLGTLAQLSRGLGLTIDDLLRGGEPDAYRIGRRPDTARHPDEQIVPLLSDPGQRLGVELIVLGPREAVRRTGPADGTGVVAVAQGLVQVQVHDGHTPAVRPGEVLVAPAHTIEGWRNVSSHEAMVFWIVRAES